MLDDLERRKLLESHGRLVTSDHGMEFDESGQGFTGHGTSYSGYQMRTPLVLRWPGRPPGRVDAPDLAQRRGADPARRALRLRESARPTTRAGTILFSDGQWDWLIAASYSEFALIEPERVTIVYPASYEIRDRDYRLVTHPTLPREDLRAAQKEMSRFYR